MKLTKGQIQDWDQMIKSGQVQAVYKALENLRAQGKPPESLLKDLASLSRRINRPDFAIHWLFPLIEKDRELQEPPKGDYWLEYASSLVDGGAIREGMRIFQEYRGEVPRDYLGMAYIAQWNYETAKDCFEDHLKVLKEDDYKYLVSLVNLISCQVYLRDQKEVERLLPKALELAQAGKKGYALSYLKQMQGMAYIDQKKWDLAAKSLEESQELLGLKKGVDNFQIKKWKVITELLKDRPSADKAEKTLDDLKKEAEDLKHWESMRNLDFYAYTLTQKSFYYDKLYYGTPYNYYREKLEASFGKKPSGFYIRGSKEASHILDLATGECNGKQVLIIDQVPHKALEALASDFYSPLRLLELYERIFPDECFNPDHGKNKIKQAIFRLNSILKKEGFDIKVKSRKFFYHLEFGGKTGIRIS